MNQHASRKRGFAIAAVFVPLFRGYSAGVFAGTPASAWVPQATMALLYGVFFAVGFLGEQSGSVPADGVRFPAYLWGFGGVSAAIGIVALAFIGLGHGLVPFGVDVAYSVVALLLLAAIGLKAG